MDDVLQADLTRAQLAIARDALTTAIAFCYFARQTASLSDVTAISHQVEAELRTVLASLPNERPT